MDASTPFSGLAHAEFESPHQMYDDARAAGHHLRLPELEQVARDARRPAPSIRYDDRRLSKGEIRVSDAAARLAAALHLHLD